MSHAAPPKNPIGIVFRLIRNVMFSKVREVGTLCIPYFSAPENDFPSLNKQKHVLSYLPWFLKKRGGGGKGKKPRRSRGSSRCEPEAQVRGLCAVNTNAGLPLNELNYFLRRFSL